MVIRLGWWVVAEELPDEAIVSVSAAVLRDLAEWPADVTMTTDAAIALALAAKLDRGGEISVAPVAKELAAVMDRLREAAGVSRGASVKESGSRGLGDLTSRIAARRAASEG